MRYKDMEINIGKIYKSKAYELEVKLEDKKKELNKYMNMNKDLCRNMSRESLRREGDSVMKK
jgi:hypothetical protein